MSQMLLRRVGLRDRVEDRLQAGHAEVEGGVEDDDGAAARGSSIAPLPVEACGSRRSSWVNVIVRSAAVEHVALGPLQQAAAEADRPRRRRTEPSLSGSATTTCRTVSIMLG